MIVRNRKGTNFFHVLSCERASLNSYMPGHPLCADFFSFHPVLKVLSSSTFGGHRNVSRNSNLVAPLAANPNAMQLSSLSCSASRSSGGWPASNSVCEPPAGQDPPHRPWSDGSNAPQVGVTARMVCDRAGETSRKQCRRSVDDVEGGAWGAGCFVSSKLGTH